MASKHPDITGPLAVGTAPAIIVKVIRRSPATGSRDRRGQLPATSDPNLGNNTDGQPVAGFQPSDDELRSVGAHHGRHPSPKPGDTVTYTGVATNRGPDVVQNPAVVFNLPPGGVVTQPAQGDGWSCTQDGTTAICGPRPAGQRAMPRRSALRCASRRWISAR